MQIPFMRLDRQFAARKAEYMAAVEAVFTHGKVLQAREVADLEARVAGLFGRAQGAAVGSCTDALVLALRALDLAPGDRVAVTALSFVASASAIALAGGVPVFVDIEPEYCQSREDTLLDLVRGRKVRGVVAVHLYGQMLELGEIYAEARRNGVFVIEDAAQALGATRHGTPPGAHSDVTCLSFDPTKVIGAQGSGGMALTDDATLAERIRRLRYHGHAGNRVYTEIGHNSQLPTVQAALLSVKLEHEAEWRARRIAIANRYSETIAGLPFATLPAVRPGNEHIFHKYVLRAPNVRDRLAAHLKGLGISTAVHYTLPLSEQPCFKGRCETAGPIVEARLACREVLSLPMYAELTPGMVRHVVDCLREAVA